ncbi:MAG: TolC family protein, partial [Opitutales bacterium]|nr:TolC family protein [Opitutales bacterium]
FNDPVLEQLITQGLENSPDIRTAVSRVAEARAQKNVTRSALLPSVDASVGAGESHTRDRRTDKSESSSSFTSSLDASWELDLFGRLRLELDASKATLAATEEDFRAMQVSLSAEIATAYASLRAYELEYEITKRNLAIQEETLELTRFKAESGDVSEFDVQSAIASIEQTRANLPTLEHNMTTSRNQIATLVGRTPGELDALLGHSSTIPNAPTQISTGIPAETLAQRPDVRSAQYSVMAAISKMKASERERLPSLRLSGSIGTNAYDAGGFFDPAQIVSSALASLSAPIFDAGNIRQQIETSREQAKQAIYAYESVLLSALSDVENALSYDKSSKSKLASLDKAVAASAQAHELAKIQYEAGSVDITTLLSAESSLLSAQTQQASARQNMAAAQIQLFKALGGGWTQEIP